MGVSITNEDNATLGGIAWGPKFLWISEISKLERDLVRFCFIVLSRLHPLIHAFLKGIGLIR